MTTATIPTLTPWRTLNPLVQRYERIQGIVAGVGLALFIWVVGTLMWGVTLDTAEAATSLDFVLLGSPIACLMFTLFAMDRLAAGVDRARSAALTTWIDQVRPDIATLARISISHEISKAERASAMKTLEQRDPRWRLKVLDNHPPRGTPAASMPTLPTATGTQTSILIGLFVAGCVGAGCVFYGVAHSSVSSAISINWAFVVGGAALIAVVGWIGFLIEIPDRERVQAWKNELVDRFSVEQIIVFQSTQGRTREAMLAKAWLDENHPGWSLSEARPLWSVVCACDSD